MSAGSKRSTHRTGRTSGAGEKGGEEHPDLRHRSAFAAFYQSHYRTTRAFFLKRGFPPQEADDLTHDVFQRAWKKRRQYRGTGAPAAWLGQIAASVYKNELRRRDTLQRQGREVELDDQVRESEKVPAFSRPDRPPDEKAARAEARQQVREALPQLPNGMRAAVEMHLGGDMTYREIADTLGVALGTAQSQIHDGKKALLDIVRRKRKE